MFDEQRGVVGVGAGEGVIGRNGVLGGDAETSGGEVLQGAHVGNIRLIIFIRRLLFLIGFES